MCAHQRRLQYLGPSSNLVRNPLANQGEIHKVLAVAAGRHAGPELALAPVSELDIEASDVVVEAKRHSAVVEQRELEQHAELVLEPAVVPAAAVGTGLELEPVPLLALGPDEPEPGPEPVHGLELELVVAATSADQERVVGC